MFARTYREEGRREAEEPFFMFLGSSLALGKDRRLLPITALKVSLGLSLIFTKMLVWMDNAGKCVNVD